MGGGGGGSKPSMVIKAHSVHSIKSASDFSFWNISFETYLQRKRGGEKQGGHTTGLLSRVKPNIKTGRGTLCLNRIKTPRKHTTINKVYIIILKFTMILDVYCILESTAHTESENKHATEICFVHMEIASLYLKILSLWFSDPWILQHPPLRKALSRLGPGADCASVCVESDLQEFLLLQKKIPPLPVCKGLAMLTLLGRARGGKPLPGLQLQLQKKCILPLPLWHSCVLTRPLCWVYKYNLHV